MPRLVNAERGEVLLTVGGNEVILCFEFGRLAAFSKLIGAKTINDCFRALDGSEPNAMIAFVNAFTIDGDARSLVENIKTIQDLSAVGDAAIQVLNVFVDPNPKKE